MTKPDESELVALVLAPRGRDAELTCELLKARNIACNACSTTEELCHRIEEGAGVALIAEEALDSRGVLRLVDTLSRQPAWSDFPIILFADPARLRGPDSADPLRTLGNVTLLDRPMGVRIMLASVQAALRARLRQYAARNAILSRDHFLAMLGHELRNPLGAIQLALEMLGRRDEAAAQHRFRSVIERQSRHLSKLVDDLLDVARVTVGKIVLHPGPVDLEAVLKSAVEALQHSARGRRLDLTLSTDGPLPVQGDRVRLDQIVENLLTNAIKYTPPGGHIHVEGRRVEQSAAIRVIDTGIGVEPSMLDAIFDLFAQADRSLDRAQGGMGLGLTLVRNLVGLHGGTVVALSDGVGRGTEFRIELPLDEAARVAVPLQPITTDDSRASKRLVVVEDSEDVRSMLTELLEALGHQVSSAINGPQGVALILETLPDIAFVDVGLPGFNGFEVARRVREATSDVMLVAVTGYGQAEDRKRAFEVGFDRHLTKPVGVTQLRKVLDEVRPARIGEQTLSSASQPPKLPGGEFAAAK